MNRFYVIVIATILLALRSFGSNKAESNITNADYAECVRGMKKFPCAHLIEILKKDNDFFVITIKYNADWGAFPNYIFVRKSSGQIKIGKANVVHIDECQYGKICAAIEKNLPFNNSLQFVSRGKTSIPAIFDVVAIYKENKIKRVILNQVSKLNTREYATGMASDGVITFLRELALITNTPAMFESIYGFTPMPQTPKSN